MRMSFSTLACPDWTLQQIVAIASECAYDAIEFRFVEGEDALYTLPAFRGSGLKESKRALSDAGIATCCVDTSCRFHSPDAEERARWLEEGERMAYLAAELAAPAIRVFGDQIQPGADRASTRRWIADSLHELSTRISNLSVGVWLETHGDFASAEETTAIIDSARSSNVGIVWDPANCMLESGDSTAAAVATMQDRIRHVHIKDLRKTSNGWTPVLTGEGTFPLGELKSVLDSISFSKCVSFEWEKKWHPDIPGAEIAIPHFASWFRKNWKNE